MSFTRDEYKNLIDEFTKDIKEQLSKEVQSLLLVGSVVDDVHILGDSDCDFVVVISEKYEKGEKLQKTLEKLGQIISKYLEDPLFSSLIDVQIVEPSLLSSISPSKILVAQNGKALIGENPFEKIEVTDEQLKESAKRLGQEFYIQMKELLLFPPPDEYQRLYMAVDAVLGCACAYLYYQGKRRFYRSNVHDILQENYADKLPLEPVFTSYKLRLGSQNVKKDNFIPEAFEFCLKVMEEISK
ncbi:MAG: nucleotidyltransferase domain-containing protein [Candidatus Heimdallarchaeaceae archaeon]